MPRKASLVSPDRAETFALTFKREPRRVVRNTYELRLVTSHGSRVVMRLENIGPRYAIILDEPIQRLSLGVRWRHLREACGRRVRCTRNDGHKALLQATITQLGILEFVRRAGDRSLLHAVLDHVEDLPSSDV